MTLSARNRLVGKVTEIEFGGVVAHVVMRVGDNVIESVITKRSAEEMKPRSHAPRTGRGERTRRRENNL